MAESLEQLQQQVDEFDRIYNTERPHQGLPGRVTPQQAWDATPPAEPPRPVPHPAVPAVDGIRVTKIRDIGTVVARGIRFHVSRTLAGQIAYLIEDEALLVFDQHGTLLIEHPWPPAGTRYVRSGRPRGRHPRTL